jgi:RNA polymerase sigma factor (TIGR02999 family)
VAGTASITQLLNRWRTGDNAARDQVIPLVYSGFKRLAAGRLRREQRARTLQPTALVHETYLRLSRQPPPCGSRSDLFGIAGRVMQQVLVQHARAHQAAKRGSGLDPAHLDETSISNGSSSDADHLQETLADLRQHDQRKAQVIELHYFGGFTVPEVADQLRVSISTVERDLRLALSWLRREMTS